jgi:SAM-dependent methyltransferase
MCETLEHLNFNPLPALQEINRILKDDGLLYLTTPNMASLKNRLALLRGRSIHNSIRDYFAQLDKNDNMIVGLHWREYTAEEVKEMLERLGFEVVNQYLYTEYTVNRKSSFKDIAKNVLIKSIPDLRERLVTIARKRVYPELDFFLCDANR